jgi:nucleoside-diphosphate-sugar epimerase
MTMADIAIIGAAGYLGGYVLDELISNNHNVTAITHGNGEIILGEKPVKILQTSSINDQTRKFDIVINLAYQIGSSPKDIESKNESLIQTIRHLSHTKTRIIHTSTLAVFGIGLDKPVVLKPVKMRADFYYTASKLSMENMLIKTFKDRELHIVRLGNIWGVASPQWTINIIKSLLFEKPVCAGKFGYSNITDSYNTANYLHFIAANSFENKLHFHHLAELGETNWEYWVAALSKKLGVAPVILPGSVKVSKSLNEDINKMTRLMLPKLKQALQIGLKGRFSGFYVRGIIEMLPALFKKPFSGIPTVQRGDYSAINMLSATSARVLFKNNTDPRWTAPLDNEASLKRILDWMPEAGY